MPPKSLFAYYFIIGLLLFMSNFPLNINVLDEAIKVSLWTECRTKRVYTAAD